MTATADALMAIFGFKRVEGNQMKTDRELLELAAKAAGHQIDPIDSMHDPEEWACWNPLTDDDDALRLAVKLRISLHWCSTGRVYAYADGDVEEIESSREGPDSSVRRAIVRAAAAIGESQQ